jgi:hypothetical protein
MIFIISYISHYAIIDYAIDTHAIDYITLPLFRHFFRWLTLIIFISLRHIIAIFAFSPLLHYYWYWYHFHYDIDIDIIHYYYLPLLIAMPPFHYAIFAFIDDFDTLPHWYFRHYWLLLLTLLIISIIDYFIAITLSLIIAITPLYYITLLIIITPLLILFSPLILLSIDAITHTPLLILPLIIDYCHYWYYWCAASHYYWCHYAMTADAAITYWHFRYYYWLLMPCHIISLLLMIIDISF